MTRMLLSEDCIRCIRKAKYMKVKIAFDVKRDYETLESGLEIWYSDT